MKYLVLLVFGLLWGLAKEPQLVNILEMVPDIQLELRYAGTNNFVGDVVDGYCRPICLVSRPAGEALKGVQAQLKPFGLGLKVFDAYRPQRAVDHFVRWAKDLEDTKMKSEYYPKVAKGVLFEQGYIAAKSGHSRGSTIDLTLVDLKSGSELDMGTPFDFFGHQSWVHEQGLTAVQRANRLLLRTVMLQNGFRPYDQEWWHFTLRGEPFPETYFDIPLGCEE